MITLAAIIGHLSLNLCLGWVFLRLSPVVRNCGENIVVSLLLGIYLETMTISSLIFIGMPLKDAVFVAFAIVLVLIAVSFKKKKAVAIRISINKLKWYEWVLLFFISEKIIFGIWNLLYTPVLFDDAMTNWSGRGRSLFGVVNWSLNPDSPVFLGFTGPRYYPLLTPLWRAITAVLNGEWNDIIARVDGLVFYLSIVSTVWLAVRRFSQERRLASGAAFIISALPLQVWHIVAGYSDIALEAFAVASLAALLRKEWLLAGVFAAGTAWSKNEGLVFYMPGLLIASILFQLSIYKINENNWIQENKCKQVFQFLLGMMTLIPWLLFKYLYSPGITPGGIATGSERFSWHEDSIKALFENVVNGSSHSIFWIFVFLSICFTFIRMCRDKNGRALLGLFFFLSMAIVLVFTFTEAYFYIRNGMTIHRSMLQLYGIAVITVTYGVWLRVDDHIRGGQSRNQAGYHLAAQSPA